MAHGSTTPPINLSYLFYPFSKEEKKGLFVGFWIWEHASVSIFNNFNLKINERGKKKERGEEYSLMYK